MFFIYLVGFEALPLSTGVTLKPNVFISPISVEGCRKTLRINLGGEIGDRLA